MLTFCVGVGIGPDQFWNMTLIETFAVIEAFRENVPGDYAGRLTEKDVQDLKNWDPDDTT